MVTIVGNPRDYPWIKRIEIVLGKIDERWFFEMKNEFEKEHHLWNEEEYLKDEELFKELMAFVCFQPFKAADKKRYCAQTAYGEISKHINEAIAHASDLDLRFKVVNECLIAVDRVLAEEEESSDNALFNEVLRGINNYLEKEINREYQIILKDPRALLSDFLDFDMSQEELSHLLDILFKAGIITTPPRDIEAFAKRHFKCFKKGQVGLQLFSKSRSSEFDKGRPSAKAREDVVEKIKKGIRS
jgi:DNA-binding transcriptional ArsR family regulator